VPEAGTGYEVDLVALERSFERALSTIEMRFQPIVRAEDSSPFGYEALLRTHEPSLPHPGAVLDAAERLNRLHKLGRAIRTDIARRVIDAPQVGAVFVNVHALDLVDRALSSPYSPLAKIADRVVFEVTERNSLESIPDARFQVAELRNMGYRLAIDDLGAGHSRMAQFSPTDTDFVKLDMSLIRDIDRHPIKQNLAASIIDLCRDQSILVIGEGVETEAEANTLRSLGCDLLQGYLIARPGALPDA
jgi:EAL domain-containing protein (putative c-di-GMP-specific phosphodiesterase class I)